jgi:altronate dehydratase
VSESVFRDVAAMINDFKSYFIRHNQPVHENPSPGNKAGGLTTLEEKSLGAIQKGGRAPVTRVLRYGDRSRGRGLALLESRFAHGPENRLATLGDEMSMKFISLCLKQIGHIS